MVKYCTCNTHLICAIHGDGTLQKVTESVSLEDFGNLHALKAKNTALLDELQAIRDTLGLQDGESVAEAVKALVWGKNELVAMCADMMAVPPDAEKK